MLTENPTEQFGAGITDVSDSTHVIEPPHAGEIHTLPRGYVVSDTASPELILQGLADLVQQAHGTAVEKGWWPQQNPRSFPECIALCHSELSEALEAYRTDYLADMLYTGENGKPEGIASELADVLIRIADMCGRWDIPLAAAVVAKLEYNRSRPFRHGNKAC